MSDLTFEITHRESDHDLTDPGFEELSKALFASGVVFVDEDVDNDGEPVLLTLVVSDGKEPQVRAILEDARSGKYGPEVRTCWTALLGS